jgi:hypothetical protein
MRHAGFTDVMADLDAVLEQLKQERERAQGELRQLEKVIAALSKVTAIGPRNSLLPTSCQSRVIACCIRHILDWWMRLGCTAQVQRHKACD